MNNNKFKRIILLVGTFAVFFAVSFVGIRYIKNSTSTSKVIQPAEEQQQIQIKEDTTKPDIPPMSIIENPEPNTPVKIEEPDVKTTIQLISLPKLNGETYDFSVNAKNMPQDITCHFELINSDGEMVQSSDDGVFTAIPGNTRGKYIVRLVDSNRTQVTSRSVSGFKLRKSTEQDTLISLDTEIEKPKKMLITKEDFLSRLLDENDLTLKVARRATDKKSILAFGFNLIIEGMKSDEKKLPTDLEGVREKIHFGTWQSAVVTDISYDEKTGQVTGVTVKPIY